MEINNQAKSVDKKYNYKINFIIFDKERQMLRVRGKRIKSTLRLFNSYFAKWRKWQIFFYKLYQYLRIKFYGV